MPGLAQQWSHVASSIIAAPAGLVGRAFFSCIDVEYYLHGKWPLDAAVLLDAAHPGSPPAAIPGLGPVPGHAGLFNGPGDFKGELTATRRGEAWLVVAGGSGLAQRLRVLSHLSATISRPARDAARRPARERDPGGAGASPGRDRGGPPPQARAASSAGCGRARPAALAALAAGLTSRGASPGAGSAAPHPPGSNRPGARESPWSSRIGRWCVCRRT